MMNKWQAQDAFWNGFGIPAYDENTVKVGTKMPYITYMAVSSALDGVMQVTASIYYKDRSWTQVDAKADEIARAIVKADDPAIPIDGGYMKVRMPESKSAERMSDPDPDVRRIVLHVEIEFLTEY